METKKDIQNLIYFFTHSKKLSRQQQRRRDALFARDCINIVDNEQNSGNAEKPNETSVSNNLVHSKLVYTDPKTLHEFLIRFNQDEILKYTCHEIDTDEVIEDINQKCNCEKYDFKKHYTLIKDSFNSLLNDFEKNNIFLDKKFVGKVFAYIGVNPNNKTWSSQNIDINWGSDDILLWSEQNEGKIPSPGRNIAKKQKNSGYRLPKALLSNISGERISTLRDLVIYFKSLFHIRRDNSLRKIIEQQINKHPIEKATINFSDNFHNNIELFTDVEKLIQAFQRIIDISINSNNNDECIFDLSFFESEGSVFFTIHDKNHSYGRSLMTSLERIGEEQKLLIRNQINGLCDLFVEADFQNNDYARIGLWTNESKDLNSDKPTISCEKLDKVEGVKYILKFSWQ